MSNLKNDVRIDKESKKFKFRVAGIILHRNKILVTKIRDNEFFFFPGGHVELLENTDDAVVRELNEELYFEVRKKKLLYIHENFFEARNSKFHELCFYHLVEPIDKNLKTDDIIWQENDKGEILFHNFKWIDLNEIKDYDIRPKVIVENFLKNKEDFKHIITNEIKTV